LVSGWVGTLVAPLIWFGMTKKKEELLLLAKRWHVRPS